jgi:ankyrin repeat protein
VFCQLVYLRRCIPGRIRRALDELPETLDETYARTLEEINKQNWEYAHRLFQCVAAASRPLLVNELAEFLAFDFEAGSTPAFLADWRPEDPAHTVLSMCSSLLAVVKPRGGSPVVQFAHFSVKEYLTSARLAKAKDTISHFHVSMTPAHTIVAQACLGVLLHLDENVTKDTLEKFPLVEYAVEHWVGHARFENVSSNVQDGMKRLFDPSKIHFSVWVWVCDLKHPLGLSEGSERPGKARVTPLYYAAFCGQHDVVRFLITERTQDVNARGFDKNETPLHVALRRGHPHVAQLLLEHGADAKARDGFESTALLLASQGGYVEVARVLLEHGADTEARDKGRWSPLERAMMGGHVEVARVLLEHGADVKAKDKYNRTPLHFAEGEEVARFLLKHGADANALDFMGRTPLLRASQYGCVGAARVLLEHGVDPNARDINNATPLHLASCAMFGSGHPDVVRLLLQYGSDIHARDDEGQTSFMVATAKRNHRIMQLLSEYGAEDHGM